MVYFNQSSTLEPLSVASSASMCVESFQRCLLIASSFHPRELAMVEDQLARFSTWAHSMGVFAPGSGSMDHRLRYSSDARGVVTGLLESLNYRIQTCSSTLAALVEDLELYSSGTSKELPENSLLDIAVEITSLNKLSNGIRRASKESQLLKASNFEIKDDEGRNVEQLLLSHFEHHIGDLFPGISENIRQRLARSMLLRRKQILYRRHRQRFNYNKPEIIVPQVSATVPDAQTTAVLIPNNSEGHQDKPAAKRPYGTVTFSQVLSATTLQPEKFKSVALSPSVVSTSRTVTSDVHQALPYPSAPGFAAKQRYEQLKTQLMADGAGSNTVPSLQQLLEPYFQTIGEIVCPYCLGALPAAEVFDERKWRDHVKKDLDPYVCVFEECNQPDVLYTHSDEWLEHLHQHGKIWRCSSHREIDPFHTADTYIEHMREFHQTQLNDSQLRLMAKRNSRKAAKLFLSCPLCGGTEADIGSRIEDHLARHLRSLALKSLPSYQEEAPQIAGSENDSVDVSRRGSQSTLRDIEEETKHMLRLRTRDSWEPEDHHPTGAFSCNFLGEAHRELDLDGQDALAVTKLFENLVSKKSIGWYIDRDPILQSILERQEFRAGVINEPATNQVHPPADHSDATLDSGSSASSSASKRHTTLIFRIWKANNDAEISGSLYQTSLKQRLARVPGLQPFLADIDWTNPFDAIWSFFRSGQPFLVIYRCLEPRVFRFEDIDSSAPTKSEFAICRIISACKIPASNFLLLTDLTGNDANGFTKVLQLIYHVLALTEQKGKLLESQTPIKKDSNAHQGDIQLIQRDLLIKNFIDTERQYVQDLQSLCDLQTTLEQTGAIPGDSIHGIFSCINGILYSQRQFLVHMETINAMSSNFQLWGLAFSENEDRFNLYKPFIANIQNAYQVARQIFDKILLSKHPVAADFNTFNSFLLKPLRRLSSYVQIFERLLIGTNDKFKKDLENGYYAARRIFLKANRAVCGPFLDEIDEDVNVREVNWESLYIPSLGKLLQCGSHSIALDAGGQDQNYAIYLFSGILLFFRGEKSKGISVCHDLENENIMLWVQYRIWIADIQNVASSSKPGSYSLEIFWNGEKGVKSSTMKFVDEDKMWMWACQLNIARNICHRHYQPSSPDEHVSTG